MLARTARLCRTRVSGVARRALADGAGCRHAHNVMVAEGRAASTASVAKAEAAYGDIEAIFEQYGVDDYVGEDINQMAHGLQAANLAREAGAADETVIASLLHDVGHMYGLEHTEERMEDCGVMDHEKLGADWLRSMGFSEGACCRWSGISDTMGVRGSVVCALDNLFGCARWRFSEGPR